MKARPGFGFRRLEKPEELRAAEELQRQSLGMEGEVPVGTTVQRAYLDNGGLVLGAFADIYLAAVTIGFIGWDGERLYHRSHGVWVRPEYQNHHLGFQLSAFLREEVLRQGLPFIRTAIDPLQSRSARLAVHALGALPGRYRPHYFGALASEANRGLETDRLDLLWELASPRSAERLAGGAPGVATQLSRWEGAGALVETELSEEGLRRPTAVTEPSGPEAHLEVPFDVAAIRANAPGLLRPWRHAVRDAFRAAEELGYRADDFALLPLEHERRAFYLLGRGPTAGGSPPAARSVPGAP